MTSRLRGQKASTGQSGAPAADTQGAPALPPLDPSRYQTQIVPLGKIKRYSNNPRKNDEAVEKTAASIKEFGWRQPIVVDPQFVIIVGDTRYLAAQLLAYPAAPVWVASDLTPEQIRAYRLADNRTHDEAEWNAGALGVELTALLDANYDVTLTGFDENELERLLARDEGSGLEPVDVRPAPTFAWVLIGIPIGRYIEISDEVEKISAVSDIFCEVSAGNTEPRNSE